MYLLCIDGPGRAEEALQCRKHILFVPYCINIFVNFLSPSDGDHKKHSRQILKVPEKSLLMKTNRSWMSLGWNLIAIAPKQHISIMQKPA